MGLAEKMSAEGVGHTGTYWNKKQMSRFWEQLPDKIRGSLEQPHRVMRLSSDDVPVTLTSGSTRRGTANKVYLFNDILAVVQGQVVADYSLALMWVCSNAVNQQANYKIHLQCPESELTLHCKDLKVKQTWLICLAETIGDALHIPVLCMNVLDNLLEQLKERHQLSYSYSSHADWKGGTYTGSWLNGEPHGKGEYGNSSNGIQYKGEFCNGKYHGNGMWLKCHWQMKGSEPVPTKFGKIRQYTGQWKAGLMDGFGVGRYINGDEYHGDWVAGMRQGYGHTTETSQAGSRYSGNWSKDQYDGYGIYDDKVRHYRYLGMFQNHCYHGTGIIITSTGTYCEAMFASNKILESHDTLLMDPNGRSFLGKVSGYFQLIGKGELTLHNSKIIGSFSGNWFEGKFQLNHASVDCNSGMENITGVDHRPPITHIDQRLCSITKASTEKWNSLFERSLRKLGFQHNDQSLHSENTLSIWNYWHLVSTQSKSSSPPMEVKSKNSPFKRSNSLPTRFNFKKHTTTVQESSSHPFPPDLKKSNGEQLHHMMKEYLEKAFADSEHHPLGILMKQLETVYHESYSGIGASRFLLPHGICDAKNIIKQLHNIVRLFFPRFAEDNQQLSMYGFKRSSSSNDPEDYVSIATGYNLLQPLVFTRIFPTLFTLYILQHEKDNQFYCRGLFSLNRLNPADLARQLECPMPFIKHLTADTESDVIKALHACSNKLSQISTLFTATEILAHMVSTFTEVEQKVLAPLLSDNKGLIGADDLLPMTIYVTIKASVPLLGAILHYLYDFAFEWHEDGGDYTVTNYEVIYHYIMDEGKRLQQHT